MTKMVQRASHKMNQKCSEMGSQADPCALDSTIRQHAGAPASHRSCARWTASAVMHVGHVRSQGTRSVKALIALLAAEGLRDSGQGVCNWHKNAIAPLDVAAHT